MLPEGVDLVQTTLLGEALEHLSVAVIVAQESGVPVAANREACRLTGYTRRELLEVPVETLVGSNWLVCKDGSTAEVECRRLPTKVAGMDIFLFLLEA
jgi:PAS domain-containing protein